MLNHYAIVWKTSRNNTIIRVFRLRKNLIHFYTYSEVSTNKRLVLVATTSHCSNYRSLRALSSIPCILCAWPLQSVCSPNTIHTKCLFRFFVWCIRFYYNFGILWWTLFFLPTNEELGSSNVGAVLPSSLLNLLLCLLSRTGREFKLLLIWFPIHLDVFL